MFSNCVCLNGELVEAGEASIQISDAGFLHGAGLFETVHVFNGNPFRLDDHLRRMIASAAALHIPLPPDYSSWKADVQRLLIANRLTSARVRLTLTPGQIGQATADDGDFHGTVLITAGPDVGYPDEQYQRGISVCVSSHRVSICDPIAGHKTLCYLPRLLALREAREKQCGEALWLTTDNTLAEGCISNVMLVSDGVVRTPPLNTPVLPGVTRGIVLELLASEGRPVREEPLIIDDLYAANEIFITNAMMGVMPVTRVERHAVGDEKPGPVTRMLMSAYRNLVSRETDSNAQ